MSQERISAASRLNEFLEEAGLTPLTVAQVSQFVDFSSLLMRWNARVNLSAIRDEERIVRRHFVESIACARALPAGIATLLDFGSGAGFPGIPITLSRPEIAVTLAESQGKKAAFLSEAVRVLGISAKVYSGRAEELRTAFDCVAMRAVDHMELAVQAGSKLVRPGGWLALMTTRSKLAALQVAAGYVEARPAAAGQEAEGIKFYWPEPLAQPGGEDQILAFGVRS
jgi:16S rRNA (guanine527-N7)-methyltransferase